MRYVSTTSVTPEMVLGSDIYDAYGRILLGENAGLTDEYIKRLTDLGFEGVYIKDKLSADVFIDPIISPELRGRGINCVRNQDIDGCLLVAKEMVREILTRENISLDMSDLREGDDFTYSHSVNVALYCCVIGIGLGLREKELEEIVVAGLVHDFGKLSIPAEILSKSERLTQEEYQIMKSHSKVSYDMLKNRWDITTNVKVAVLFHHENVDGSGYPNGIIGDEMTQYTKILHVADVYDALVSKRPYKRYFSAAEASEYMMGACGIMFDKEIVTALLKYVPVFPKGIQMKLSDGRQCIIVDNNGRHALKPVVRTLDGQTIDLSDKHNLNLNLDSNLPGDKIAPKQEEERLEMVKPFHRYKIMVVDDMMTNLQLMRGILEYMYDVTLVKSGRQALAFLNKNEAPDVIVMDIDMPQMDGLQTAKAIRDEIGLNIPILFVTAISNREMVSACQELGAAGYIVRPYKPAFIKSELKRILTGRGDVE